MLKPEAIREVGRTLFGDEYHGALADALGVNVRTVQRWTEIGTTTAKGAPESVAQELRSILRDRFESLSKTLDS